MGQINVKKKKKKKNPATATTKAPKKVTDVEIKVGIAAQTDGVLKSRRGKTKKVTVKSTANKEDIIRRATEKHADQSFDDRILYVLLYPDFRRVDFVPGTMDPFMLSSNKEAIRKDYKRLTFFLIPYDDFAQNSEGTDSDSSANGITRPPSPSSPHPEPRPTKIQDCNDGGCPSDQAVHANSEEPTRKIFEVQWNLH